jgi:hypothetical protein
MRHFPTALAAAKAHVQAEQPYKRLAYADGHTTRELNRDEQWMLESILRFTGSGNGGGGLPMPSPALRDRRVGRCKEDVKSKAPGGP